MFTAEQNNNYNAMLEFFGFESEPSLVITDNEDMYMEAMDMLDCFECETEYNLER